jgi:hypothetical protein
MLVFGLDSFYRAGKGYFMTSEVPEDEEEAATEDQSSS